MVDICNNFDNNPLIKSDNENYCTTYSKEELIAKLEELNEIEQKSVVEINPVRINSNDFENTDYTIEDFDRDLRSKVLRSIESYVALLIKCIGHSSCGKYIKKNL
jgi:hypothetical protein